MNKILILEQGSEYGGVNKILSLLLASFKDDYEVECKACFLYKAAESETKLNKSKDVTYIHNGSYPQNRLLRLFKFAVIDTFLIFRELVKQKPDWVVSFGSLPLLQIVALKKILGYKLLVSERNDPYLLNDRIHSFIRKQYGKADKVVFQSKAAMDFFDENIKSKAVIIPNPVNVPKNRWKPNNNKKIITVGRIENKQKRGDVLIRAFSLFCNNHDDFILEFVGTGSATDVNNLKSIAEECKINKRIVFSGYSANPIEKLLQADLFVLSSDYEGMPNALLEAMSVGMPVVTTDYSPGGVSEIVAAGCGLIVNRGDVNGLANAMADICDNQDVSKKFGENAYERIKPYYKYNVLKMWKQCFC